MEILKNDNRSNIDCSKQELSLLLALLELLEYKENETPIYTVDGDKSIKVNIDNFYIDFDEQCMLYDMNKDGLKFKI